MSENKLEGADLKKMVKLGKKKALSFAFCPGAKNAHTMMIDRRKSPEMLGKLARKEGDGNKVGFGTFEVKGRVMEMTCGRTVPQMAKTIKKYLKSQKILVNVAILDMDGNPLDSDVEDLPPDPTMEDTQEDQVNVETDAQEPEDDQDTSNQPAELVARLKALQPAIATAKDDTAGKLKKVAAAAVAFIKSSDFESADTAITGLETAVAKIGAPTPQTSEATPPPKQDTSAQDTTGQDMSALAKRAKALQVSISGLAEPAKGKLTKALAVTIEKIKAQDHVSADALLTKLETALGKVSASNETEAPSQDANTDPTQDMFIKLRASWVETRTNMRNDVESLKSAIDTATSGIDGLNTVSAKSSVLFSYLDEFNDDLEQTLHRLADEAGDGVSTELKGAALQIVEKYKGVLDTGFFKEVDNNGFVKTNIRSSALKSLQQVSNALAT